MTGTTVQRPATTEYAQFYHGYVSAVPEGDLLDVLQQQGAETDKLLRAVSEERSRFRYGPGKWSVREVAGHLADAERVFTYRALTFARADATPLPSFEENAWAAVSNADRRPLSEHVDELASIRSATLALLRGFTPTEFARVGTASGHKITVRALAYIVAGHERHHLTVLLDRYGL